MESTTGYEDESSSDSEPGSNEVMDQLSETEKYIYAKLTQDGYSDVSFDDYGLKIGVRYFRGSSSMTRFNRAVPRESFADLKEQLDWNYSEHPYYVGYIAPSFGMVEICLQRGGKATPGAFPQILRASKDLPPCEHLARDLGIPILKQGPIRCRISDANGEGRIEAARLHFTRRDGMVCLELSHGSPLLAPMAAKANENVYYSVKLYFDDLDLGADIVDESEEILHSFLYELNARNNIIFSALRWPLGAEAGTEGRRGRLSALPPARFPLISIDPEIAKLFSFASQATGNLTMAFLSYYQILEHFLFAMIRRGVVRELRNTLFDRKFNERSDTSLMKLIDIVELNLGGIESKHLRTLIKGCVRRDQVTEFLNNDSWGAYFTNKGPIKGVRPLNPKDKSVDLLDQVAERVYKLRNRIVHAKDEPKYGDSRVLMPESREADSLEPDVQLIRLLAMEVIHESQVR